MSPIIVTALVALVAALVGAFVAARATKTRTEYLQSQFKALSVDALDANTERFLQLAREQLEQERLKATGDLEQRQQAIGELVKPVTAKLAEVDQKITQFDKGRAATASALTEQINALRTSGEQLRAGATALTRALRQPQGRGQWGELQLRNVVEMAGMAEHCRDFTTQHSMHADERMLRPDMVVNMPNGRCVVIDSKAPLDAFLSAMEVEDDESAEPHLQRHAEQVRTHVAQLSKKDYSAFLDGALADMVVLFLPAEHLFAAAVRQRPTLVEEAFGKRVIIASPTTLMTLLHAISIGWREERLARNAEEIAQLGRELHHRVATMATHFAKVGKGLETAMKGYNSAVGSLETSVLPQTRRFEKLDAAKASTDMPVLEESSVDVRQLQARELVAVLDPDADDEAVA